MKNSQIKIHTKQMLIGSIAKSGWFIILSLLALAFFTILPVTANHFIRNSSESIIVSVVSMLIYACIRCAFRSGSGAWFGFYKSKNRAEKALYWFAPKRIFRSMGLYSSLFFRKLFWTILFLSPGVITIFAFCYLAYDTGIEFNLFLCGVSGGAVLTILGVVFRFVTVQRYFLAREIFVTDPQITVTGAIRKSCEKMEGKLKRTALFKLSFIPWFLLCIGIFPVLYVWPYYRQSCVLLSEEIK